MVWILLNIKAVFYLTGVKKPRTAGLFLMILSIFITFRNSYSLLRVLWIISQEVFKAFVKMREILDGIFSR